MARLTKKQVRNNTSVTTTIQLEEKQLKRLMEDKSKYRLPYYEIIDGYQKLIDKFKLKQELDDIMKEKVPK